MLFDQARQRNPNPNFSVRIFSGGAGVFHMKEWGAKMFGTLLETRDIKLFWREIPEFCWDMPAVAEKFEKTTFVFNFWPLVDVLY